MVLQQQKVIPVWGHADPGGELWVTLHGQSRRAMADKTGQWRVYLPPMSAGGPYEMRITGRDTVIIRDILIGEVWLCSGQSNMEMTVQSSANAREEIAGAGNPQIRLYMVPKRAAGKPLQDIDAEWQICDSVSVRHFSAAGYFFGRELHNELKCPLGLIKSAYGATPAESWMPESALEQDAELRPLFDFWQQLSKDVMDYKERFESYYDRYMQVWQDQVAKWRRDDQQARSQGKPMPPFPDPVMLGQKNTPGVLYNAMIAPLIPYSIRGVVWYQGESNAGRAVQYRRLFPALIRSWRQAWQQKDLPFLFVQLAGWQGRQKAPVEKAVWAELREAQAMTLQSMKHTGMAVAADIGEVDDVHPKNKQEVGKRLARWALADVYNRKLIKSGPLYKSVQFKNNFAILSFHYAVDGLLSKNNEPLKGFAIAGADSQFVWAQARILGDKVMVWSDEVKNPLSVRYSWATHPIGNLYNQAFLPASPFRTDAWPDITRHHRTP
jgi:sialate O-acetylesterase